MRSAFGQSSLALVLFCAVAGWPTRPTQAQPAPVMDWQQPALKRLQPSERSQVLMLGEQHDAPEHQMLQKETIEQLARTGRLAAVVMEMIEDGFDTRELTQGASEADTQKALSWSQSWPWKTYGPVVMAAVRAGVPVWGGNLPRAQMRSMMQNSSLDSQIPATAFSEQQARIREGHCNMLPESQIIPMTRIQLARDQAMARRILKVIDSSASSDKQVLLIAGNGHVRRDLGVPLYLPAQVSVFVVMALPRPAAAQRVFASEAATPSASKPQTPVFEVQVANAVWQTPERPPQDYCADMKKQMGR